MTTTDPRISTRTHTAQSHEFLESLTFSTPQDNLIALNRRRVACPKCKRMRHAYCYDCMIPIEEVPTIIPRLEVAKQDPDVQKNTDHLPIKCLIIQHPNESKSKSSAIHARVIAPDAVTIVQYGSKEIDDIMGTEEGTGNEQKEATVNRSNAVLLYPDNEAWDLNDLLQELIKKEKSTEENTETAPQPASESESDAPKRTLNHLKRLEWVVFIDSTWQQSKRIFRDGRVNKLTHVKIKTQKTAFWRYQNKGNDFLATIEAIYWFYREYWTALTGRTYTHQFDDLLYLYKYQYDMIQNVYQKQARVFPRIEGYTEGITNKKKLEERDSSEEPPKKRQRTDEEPSESS